MELTKLSLNDFFMKLMNNELVPGEGSIVALNGAVASSLTGMVAKLTIGRKEYLHVEDGMKDIIIYIKEIQKCFMESINLLSSLCTDVSGTNKVLDVMEAEQRNQELVIRENAKEKVLIHLRVARHASRILPLINEVAYKGSQESFTDICMAMMCCHTAIVGAILNIRISLKTLQDKRFAHELEDELESMEYTARELEKELLDYAKKKYGLLN